MTQETPLAYDRRRTSRITGVLLTWLDAARAAETLPIVAQWDAATWQNARWAVLMQGLGPYLHHTLPGTPLYAAMPADFRQWLAEGYAANAARVAQLHADLRQVLQAANRHSVRVMLLKGSLLSTHYYAAPALRPMADLDVLVQRETAVSLPSLLAEIGYQPVHALSNVHANHLSFMHRDTPRVVSWAQEDAANPRRLDVHLALRRGTWGRVAAYDLTDFMWQAAGETTLWGERVWLPAPDRLLAHLTIHACQDLLFHGGRLLQWLDILHVARQVDRFVPPYPNWMLPPLRLLDRGLPGALPLDVAALRPLVDPRVWAWTDRVPLDGRCGLTLGPSPYRAGPRRFHWERWHPTPWRLRLGYYHLPLPLAYGVHLLSWGRRWWEKLRGSAFDNPAV
ncbi:MAG: nucleotidyltransferase family protein [Anaerolineales bacterium]|nr:nucleotidyltransferase family protein [Anaerolineales bacterium]